MRVLIAISLLSTLFYLNTAIILGLGGPGETLVIKPLHGFKPVHGGGEENSWIHAYPGEELPWWHYPNKNYVMALIRTSTETSTPTWMSAYLAGYRLWPICIAGTAGCWLYRRVRRKHSSSAALGSATTTDRTENQ